MNHISFNSSIHNRDHIISKIFGTQIFYAYCMLLKSVICYNDMCILEPASIFLFLIFFTMYTIDTKLSTSISFFYSFHLTHFSSQGGRMVSPNTALCTRVRVIHRKAFLPPLWQQWHDWICSELVIMTLIYNSVCTSCCLSNDSNFRSTLADAEFAKLAQVLQSFIRIP